MAELKQAISWPEVCLVAHIASTRLHPIPCCVDTVELVLSDTQRRDRWSRELANEPGIGSWAAAEVPTALRDPQGGSGDVSDRYSITLPLRWGLPQRD